VTQEEVVAHEPPVPPVDDTVTQELTAAGL